MNVLLLNQYFAPAEAATARLLADLASKLVADGHDVRCVCANRSYLDPARRFAPRETLDGVTVERVGSTGFGRGSRIGRVVDYATFMLGALIRGLVGRRPHVVVSLTTPPLVAVIGLLIARLRGARSVAWVMDLYPDLAFELGVLRRRSLLGRALAALAGFTMRRSDCVIALGDSMAARLAAHGAREVHVVHNWSDGEAVRPRSIERHPLRAAWGWDGRFVLLYSGNLGLAHEFDTLLEAAERLRGRAELLVALVGAGPRRREVADEVARRGLTNVEFRPWVDDSELGLGLTAGDLHLVTLRDGLAGLLVPSKIYGILAAGRPTLYVGPADGEIASIVDRGGCGSRVAPGDAGALVALIESYADSPQRVADEGRRARRLFDERFTRSAALERLARLVTGAAIAPSAR